MATQRTYRAACPNCGAPVEFKSAGSRLAVCEFCRSSLSRDGDTLERIGQMAELFDDHSPLQFGVTGRLPDSFKQGDSAKQADVTAQADAPQKPLTGSFSLVGRLQYRYEQGVWNEWLLLTDSDQRAWLSEDNGSYALTRDLGERDGLPSPDKFQAGQNFRLEGRGFQIASITQAQLIAAAGELPFAPKLNEPFWLVDARSADGTIATLEYSLGSDSRARIFQGSAITLAALSLSGLKDESNKALGSKSLACPNCGAAIEIKLDGSKSITCASCASLVDLTGADPAKPEFTPQSQRFASPIPLGTVGKIEGIEWQALGFARRSAIDNDGEQFSWAEVLLYNRTEGFAFVVVASDALSLVRPIQDAPAGPAWSSVRYRNRQYRGEPNYQSVVDYVEGEFYWQVRIGQRMRHVDYKSDNLVLSREESLSKEAREVVWSHGKIYPASELAKAFGLPDISQLAFGGAGNAALRADLDSSGLARGASATGGALSGAGLAAPTSGSLAIWVIILVVIALIIFFVLLADSGGSGSGYSGSGRGYSGGSHK